MRIHRAQAALGIHVQADRLQHRIRKRRAQERQRKVLVLIVDAVGGGRIHTQTLQVQQMPEVMQQCGSDERIRRTRLFRQRGGLQRVFKLGDGLAAVGDVAVAVE